MPAPSLCPHDGEAFAPFYIETFEQEVNTWTKTEIPGAESTWSERKWLLADQLPDSRLGKAMYAATPNAGNCSSELDHGILRLQSPTISIPEDIDGDVLLTFNHYFSFEKGQDGGNLKVQRNGNNWMNIPPSAFLHNGYNDYLTAQSNPLVNQKVFSGANQGSVAGSWGTSQIKLSVLGVRAGDELVIRWEVGTDGCDGWDGWYIDDVLLATCSAAAALPVQYLSFEAQQKNKNVYLDWETAQELNNKGFHIERSFDGQRFNTIGWVASTEAGIYQFIDTQVKHQERIYYRLRQEDFDGNTSFSDTRIVRQSVSETWHVYPNPAKDYVHVQLDEQTVFPIIISIRTLDGRLLESETHYDKSHLENLSLPNLNTGLYLIQLQNDVGVSYRHLMVQ